MRKFCAALAIVVVMVCGGIPSARSEDDSFEAFLIKSINQSNELYIFFENLSSIKTKDGRTSKGDARLDNIYGLVIINTEHFSNVITDTLIFWRLCIFFKDKSDSYTAQEVSARAWLSHIKNVGIPSLNKIKGYLEFAKFLSLDSENDFKTRSDSLLYALGHNSTKEEALKGHEKAVNVVREYLSKGGV